MARTKVQADPVLKNWGEVDEALRQIMQAQAILTKHELEMNELIAKAKSDSEAVAQPLHTEIKELGLQIKEFVTAHKDELDGKTKKLNFGSTGFRMSTKLMIPRGKDGDVLAALKKMGLADCIKVTETIRKDVLRQMPEATILQTGAYLKPSDEFWYEVATQEIEDTTG